ncbi:hypothetical protein [Acidovorax sp. NCPPB 4044]|uniref:hypothetical protein n=1 Tax=Acidovorax sp. NCPPB 4044 TaxID=2940490 RepID=UPI00230216DC|nr:hypothetical protein [Acidovorax sp. NCPPB 4044]MDA8522943.1 hypothetical protein [Acidovorax sp. NCPPB 4044]
MRHEITLNIPYDLSDEQWAKVMDIYASLDGWLGDRNEPAWYGREGDERCIGASVEPGGIQFFGEVETPLWTGWLTVLCARMSLALGREVHDAEV